jgi:hypothetical protein
VIKYKVPSCKCPCKFITTKPSKSVVFNTGARVPPEICENILRGISNWKEKYYFVVNTGKSGPDLGLDTGDPYVRTFDLGALLLSLPSLLILDVDYRLCLT